MYVLLHMSARHVMSTVALSPEADMSDLHPATSRQVAFVSLLGVVTLEMALVARYWTKIYVLFIFLSYALVYPYMIVYPIVGERRGVESGMWAGGGGGAALVMLHLLPLSSTRVGACRHAAQFAPAICPSTPPEQHWPSSTTIPQISTSPTTCSPAPSSG